MESSNIAAMSCIDHWKSLNWELKVCCVMFTVLLFVVGEDEISFDIITEIKQIDEGWWRGRTPDGSYMVFSLPTMNHSRTNYMDALSWNTP